VTSDIASSLGLAEVRGAIVNSVTTGSPADRAGIKRGDVITKLNGASISDSNSLRNHVAKLQPGSQVTLTVMREGKERSLTATLGERRT
jgi:serine protease DegQ